MDASPIAMVGTGPAVSLRLDWGRSPDRLHRVQLGVLRSSSVAYDSPRRSILLDGTSLGRIEGSYEYRRYPFRNLLIGGLDVGLGFESSAGRKWFNHELDPSVRIRQTETEAGLAGVAAAHLHRWQRVGLEVAWINGGILARSTQRHIADHTSSSASFGGGWVTSLRIVGDVRVSRRTSLDVAYVGDDGGLLSSHHGITSCGRRLTVGVTYER